MHFLFSHIKMYNINIITIQIIYRDLHGHYFGLKGQMKIITCFQKDFLYGLHEAKLNAYLM